MTATFSDEDYRRVMMLAFLGEWMVNAIQKDPDPKFEDLALKVYAFAKGTSLEPLITFDEPSGSWNPSDAFDAEAHALIDQYDDKTFWEELTVRLAERDLIEKHGERAVRGMRPEQRSRAAGAIAKAYTKEFENTGIDRLKITE